MHSSEKHTRSVVKAISYRILSIFSDGLIVFLITHRYDITVVAVFTTNFVSMFLYFFHERLWNRVHWGRVLRSRNIEVEDIIEAKPLP